MRYHSFIHIFLILVSKLSFGQRTDSMRLNNGAIYYYTLGQGEPVLLLSGGPGLSYHQEYDLALELSKKYKAILFDQRGTGKSWTTPLDSTTININQAIEDIELLRKYLKIKKLNLSGHSWGAMLAAAYIAKYPGNVNLALFIGGGEIDVELTQAVSANINLRRQLADTAIYDYWTDAANAKKDSLKAARELRRYRVSGYIYDRSKLDAVCDHVTHASKNATMSQLMWKSLLDEKFNLITQLNRYKGPTLLVFGWEDPVGVTTLSQYMKAFPAAEIKGIDKCGHFPSIEQPEAFNNIVNTFLATHLK